MPSPVLSSRVKMEDRAHGTFTVPPVPTFVGNGQPAVSDSLNPSLGLPQTLGPGGQLQEPCQAAAQKWGSLSLGSLRTSVLSDEV